MSSTFLCLTCLALIPISGCAVYHPLPLTSSAVEKALTIPSGELLQREALRLKHPIVRPIELDPREPLSPDSAAIAGMIAQLPLVQWGDGYAIARIRDSGIGIAPDVLPHIFELFVQADPSSRRADAGLGIGLALVRSLAERHGGRVTVVSDGLGHGSEFTVRLPRPVD